MALTMPQFGESITEALIVRWLKKEGQDVKEQEPILELETEKSVFSYESPFQGKLIAILQKENQSVVVGTEIAHFEVADNVAKKYLALGIGKVVGGGPTPKETPVKAVTQTGAPPISPLHTSSGHATLSPLIRSLAKEKGIPLDEVEKIPGTGPEGRLTKEDFLKYLETRGQGSGEREGGQGSPLTPIRARIAEKMSLSKRTIPHAGTGVDADVTNIAEWRQGNKPSDGFLAFVLFSTVPALKKFPILNSSFKEKEGRQWVEDHPSVNLGIATSTPQGLMVPVLHQADQLSFRELVERGNQLIEKARTGRLEVSELTGGTFTVNNTGALGAVRSQQIIQPPQSGSLAVNRVIQHPWVVQNEIKIRSILSLDLAFDHRLVDGDAAVGFLQELKQNLENFDFSVVR